MGPSAYDLPTEVLLRILSFVHVDALINVSKTNRLLRTVSDLSVSKTLDLSEASLSRQLPTFYARNLARAQSVRIKRELLSPFLITGILTHLAMNPNLTFLDLSTLQIPSRALAAFFRMLPERAKLETVLLNYTRQPDEPILELITRHGKTLRHLDLDFTEITGTVMDAIHKNCYRTIETLSLAGCFHIGQTALKRFMAQLPPKLRVLDVKWNFDFEVGYLMGCNGMRALEELDIRGCDLTLEDVNELKQSAGRNVTIRETATEQAAEMQAGWSRCHKAFGIPAQSYETCAFVN